ncbi:MAG: dipeptidase [Acidobacteriia bacterium]|nr:dipeptidase [Terriglobia bacterium]
MSKRHVCIGVMFCLATVGAALFARPAEEFVISERARRLHQRAIVVDTHVDVPYSHFSKTEFDFSRRHAPDWGHVDIPRMREGGLDAPFFSIYIPATVTGPEAVKRALQLIAWTRALVERHPQAMALATTAADVRRIHREGRIAVLLGMEGGHMIADDLLVLRTYADLGVRYLTLAHSRSTNWAGSSGEDDNRPLTDFGRQVVRELNRLGVLVDISHVSDQTFWDALAVSEAPMIASHSSCRALCDHPRNMTDEMIRALARKGGVIQITFVDTFLSQELRDAQRATEAERNRRIAELRERFPNDPERQRSERERIFEEYRRQWPRVSWERIVDHIDHAVKVAGVDHVGLGSDFDGATMPDGMDDCTMLPKLTEALLRRGYSERDIEKILGGNLLRVLEQAERVAQRLRER